MSRIAFSWLSGPLAVSCRSFKTKTSVAQEAAAKKAAASVAGGRDPYGLFKQAINHRINGHFTKMIAMREAAVAALPEALQQEARLPDLTLLPIQRRIFTETAPIPDFQAKLLRPAGQE
eukprot:jgi/Chrpa1/24988/Chrysochromulina_OHIO_Genome00011313-RA